MSKNNKPKTNKQSNNKKITTPTLQSVKSPEPSTTTKTNDSNSTRVSIRRSSNSPSLIDIAEGKSISSDSKSLKSFKSNQSIPISEEESSPKDKELIQIENTLDEPVLVQKESILEYTPISEISHGVEKVRTFFHTNKTHSIQFRLNQLRNLYFMIKDNQDSIIKALELDFNRNSSETKNYEILTGLNELVFTMSQLFKWSKREKITDLPINLQTQQVYIEKIPLGVVLVIAAFNYPFFVSISPIVGAIAGGNCVVYKPSELTPNFSKLFTNLLYSALDSNILFIVNGEIPETTELLNQRFDKIIFTGSNMVGKIVSQKAAEFLTPCVLELGGKSPAIILDDVLDKDLETIARRIAWGRFVNSGQTCIGVDYILIHESLHDKFINVLVKVLESFFPNLSKDDKGYTHMINNKSYQRMVSILSSTNGKNVFGGELDSNTNFVSPTIITDVDWNDSTMKDEIFGPILPILKYKNLNQSLDEIVLNCDTPLSTYIFTSKSTSSTKNKQIEIIKQKIRSGGLIINDVLLHIALHNAPFGGIGQSGYGSYHGKFSYKTFTHERTTIEQGFWNDFMLNSRYPPYSTKKDEIIKTSQQLYNGKTFFNRIDNVPINGPSYLFSGWNSMTGLINLAWKFATK